MSTVRGGSFGADRHRIQTVQWVCDALRAELSAGAYPDVLPSEASLTRKYGVSRGAIRQVLLMLTEQRLVERVRGAGTFVTSRAPLLHDLEYSRDVAQEVNLHGMRVAIRPSSVTIRPGVEYIAHVLGIDVGDDVVIIESTSFLDGFPLSIRSAFMPADMFGGVVRSREVDLERSPYDFIADVIGGPVGDTELRINSSIADSATGQALDVPVGSPLLRTTRVIRDPDGRAVEFSVAHARGDRITFTTLMESRGTTPAWM